MFSRLRTDFFQRLDVRLTAYYTCILLVLATIFASFLYYRLEHNLMKQVDRLLHDEAYELIVEIYDEIAEGKTVIEGCDRFLDDISSRKYYPLFFRVFASSGKLICQPQITAIPWDFFPEIKNSTYYATIPVEKQRFRLYEESFTTVAGEKYVLQISTQLKQHEKTLENFYGNILRAIPIMLLLCLGGGMLIARKPILIIRDITKVTNRITSQNLRERLPEPPAHDEVWDLTVTINSMMDRLEKSFSEIKQFSSDVSHELRNPLFALKGSIEVALSHKREAPAYRETLQECLERINLLITMVNDLFLIARFDSGKITLACDYLQLDTLVREMVDFFQPLVDEKNIKIKTDLCSAAPLYCDRIRLTQVLNNLLENAIKFTPHNGEISISLVGSDDEIKLRVRDSGIGIAEEEIEKIFDRFYQADQARSAETGGAGLGLQICKRIVDAHGGSIEVKNNADKGITVTVTLPLNHK